MDTELRLAAQWEEIFFWPEGERGGTSPRPSNDGGSLTYMKHMILIGGEKAYTCLSHGT